MRIIVDYMPDEPSKCKFHTNYADGAYLCGVTKKKCPLSNNHGTCRVLKPISDCTRPSYGGYKGYGGYDRRY